MADDKPKTVTVKSLALHTYNGKEYPEGAHYEIDEQFADSVVVQGKAVRLEVDAPAARTTTKKERE